MKDRITSLLQLNLLQVTTKNVKHEWLSTSLHTRGQTLASAVSIGFFT